MQSTDSICQTKLSILLVDDEEDIRDLLGMLLDDLGYDVHSAENSEVAHKALGSQMPDIVLTDIKMPGMSGIELLKTIKRENPEIEVIMISGHGDMQLAIESLKHDAADFITKPIDDEILAIALDKVTEKILLKRQVADYTTKLEQMVEQQSARLVELERTVAVEQVVEGLTSAMSTISDDMDEEGLFSELPCYLSVHSSDMKIVTANHSFAKRFGNLAGKSSRTIYKDYSGQGSCPAFEAIANRSAGRGSATLITNERENIPAVVYTAPIKSSHDKVSLVLEVAVDVSEMNRLRTELVQTQKKYEHIFNQVPCYITIQDKELRIVEANNRFQDDFGFEHGERCHQAYKNKCEVCHDCPVIKTFEDGETHQHETVVTSKNGKTYNILVWTAPILNDSGEVEHVLEVSTNITMVRQLQDQLTSLGMMLGSMAHGVKGLLGALDGGIYRVDSGLKKQDMERVEKGWKVVKHRLRHMRKMVLDTLYYAKSRDLDIQTVNLNDFANDLAETVAPKAAEHRISFVRDFNGSNSFFQADPNALSPALVNFLENAIDACLYDRSKSDHEVVFRAYEKAASVHFVISDNGTGMDRETRENMFTLFFSSKGANGTGIGLFISNQIISLHNGSIEVDSIVGKGTRFHIRLAPSPEASYGNNRQINPD